MPFTPHGFIQTLQFSLSKRCPRCGNAPIFKKWGELNESCPQCGLPLKAREPDTWFFMYMSTAAITGIFLIFFFFIPPKWKAAHWVIPVTAGIAFLATHPVRKSLAIGFDFWLAKDGES